MTSATIAVSLVFLLTPAGLLAQEGSRLAPGSRVQVHLTDPKPHLVRGTLVGGATDSVRMLTRGGRDTLVFSSAAASQLDTTAGQRTRTGKGAVMGGAIGAGLGLALGIAAAAEGCSGFCTDVGAGQVAGAALIFGGIGAAVGALIGSATHTDRWLPASKPWTVVVAPGIGEKGMGMRLTVGIGSGSRSRVK